MFTMLTLPEELLRDVLSHFLTVDEEKFCAFPEHGYLRKRQAWTSDRRNSSRSDVLLVSKQWLRIGTPVLYEKVAFREAAHTKAVAELVKANPAVGRAIKYLRLEGGMGKDLVTIVKYAPNIHTLWITPHVRASESITGLRKTIALLQPRKLYFFLMAYIRGNKTEDEIQRLIAPCIARSWASLNSITIFKAQGIEYELSRALQTAPALKELSMQASFHFDMWLQEDYFAAIARNEQLQQVTLHGKRYRRAFIEAAAQQNLSSRQVDLFKFEETQFDRMMANWWPTANQGQDSGNDEE